MFEKSTGIIAGTSSLLRADSAALACQPEPLVSTTFDFATAPVPVEDLVAFATYTNGACGQFDGVVVVDAAGSPVAGENDVSSDGKRAYWRPAQPLVVGTTYAIQWSSSPPGVLAGGGRFTAVAPGTLKPLDESTQALREGGAHGERSGLLLVAVRRVRARSPI
jgi:hypothetical protein